MSIKTGQNRRGVQCGGSCGGCRRADCKETDNQRQETAAPRIHRPALKRGIEQ